MTTKYYPIRCTPTEAFTLHEGRQTQDRRPIKPQPQQGPDGSWWLKSGGLMHCASSPDRFTGLAPWQPGDVLYVLWVKEPGFISSHMSKWDARTFLRVESVRVQRIQEIREEDARAEGCASITTFRALWNSLYSARGLSWDQNPWVWAYNLKLTAKPKGWPEGM